MRYRLHFKGANGQPYTILGFKDVSGQTFARAVARNDDAVHDALRGTCRREQAGAEVVASGVIKIRPEDFFFMQMFSFRVQGPTPASRAQSMARFGKFFFGKVWDVYGHQTRPVLNFARRGRHERLRRDRHRQWIWRRGDGVPAGRRRATACSCSSAAALGRRRTFRAKPTDPWIWDADAPLKQQRLVRHPHLSEHDGGPGRRRRRRIARLRQHLDRGQARDVRRGLARRRSRSPSSSRTTRRSARCWTSSECRRTSGPSARS